VHWNILFCKNQQILAISCYWCLSSVFANYYYGFVTNYNEVSKSAWQYEYKEIFEKQKEGCISDQYAQPYIFGLYYNKVDPSYFSTRVLNPVNDWGFTTVRSFCN
jgi:hypothetical protein